jgi:hypothetical protein
MGKQSRGRKEKNKQKEKKETKRGTMSGMSNKPYPNNKIT